MDVTALKAIRTHKRVAKTDHRGLVVLSELGGLLRVLFSEVLTRSALHHNTISAQRNAMHVQSKSKPALIAG